MAKYIRKILAGIASLLLLCSVTAQAAEEPAVVEHYTAGEEAILYIRGIEGGAEAGSYQIGTTPCEITGLMSVRETEEGIKTLILWDNSLSVMKRCGDRVKTILTDVIANRVAGEEFSIATIDEGITYLSDYTDDYAALKQIIEGISGENKDAYIIENLYQAIESLNAMDDVSYKRILVISDGMDSTEIGYSKSELDTLISQTPYPVYTIGISDGKHQEELQNMFALSRTTGVEYFYLNEIEDDMTVVQGLSVDYSVLQVRAAIPAEIQDGSMLNSQLVLNVGGSDIALRSQVLMPFATQKETEEVVEPSAEEEPSTEEASSEQDLQEEPEPELEPEQEKAGGNMIVWLAAGGVAAILAIILIIVLIQRGKKQKAPVGNDYAKLDSSIRNERRGNDAPMPSGVEGASAGNTAVIGAGASVTPAPTGKHKTQMLFDNPVSAGAAPGTRRIMLVNVKNAVQTYQCNIVDRVIIGRNSFVSNLTLDDDAVSEKHCEIALSNGRFYVTDLGSSNGTYVNGIQISTSVEVHAGTVLRLGRHEYRLMIE